MQDRRWDDHGGEQVDEHIVRAHAVKHARQVEFTCQLELRSQASDLSLAVGRAVSFAIDGRASLLLDIYFILEVLGGLLGLAVLAYEDRKTKQ